MAKVKVLPDITMPDPWKSVRPAAHQVLNLSNPCDEAGQKLVIRNKSRLIDF